MQSTQKFDPSKSYAMVYGHPEALYEQNGILFGGDNLPVEDNEGRGAELVPNKKSASKKSEEGMSDFTDETDFLTTLLAGGPIMQLNIKKEAEKKDFVWDDILSVAAKLDVNKFKKGAAMMWRLQGDE